MFKMKHEMCFRFVLEGSIITKRLLRERIVHTFTQLLGLFKMKQERVNKKLILITRQYYTL